MAQKQNLMAVMEHKKTLPELLEQVNRFERLLVESGGEFTAEIEKLLEISEVD